MSAKTCSTIKTVQKSFKTPDYKYASASKVFNTLQYYKKILILDLRESELFHKSHFSFSINLPASTLTSKELINFDQNEFVLKHFTNSKDKELFSLRKRLMVYILSSQKITEVVAKDLSIFENPNSKKTSKSTVLACLLYEALSKERIRELYILNNGFKNLLQRFPFLCNFENHKIYLEP